MSNILRSFAKDDCGATAIEYGLIAALLSISVIVALSSASASLITLWNTISGALATAVTGNPGG